MTEAQIQSRIIKAAKAKGYMAIKIISANINGLPDILLLPPRDTFAPIWVEVKGSTGKLSELQKHRIHQLRHKHDQFVSVITGDEEADFFISNAL